MVGELAEDCSSINLDHHKPLRRVLSHLIGKKLEVGVKQLKYTRSNAQNRWLWGVAYIKIAGWFKNTMGLKVSKDTIHDYSIQHIIGAKEYDTVAFSKSEFQTLVSEIIQLVENDKSESDIQAIVDKNMKHWETNVSLTELMGKRTVINPEVKTTSKMNTVEFGDFKDTLQAYYAERGCDIPDPRENNFLSDFIEDE